MSETSLLTSRAPRVALAMACLFSANGMVLPFLGRWLEVERGLIGAEIGMVLALPQLARLVTGPMIAHWADRAGDRRVPLGLIGVAALVAYGAFFYAARGFWPLLALGFVALSLAQAATPLVEAALLRATAQGRLSYGVARAIGSLAFIVANVVGGALVARFGLGAVAWWVVCNIAMFALAPWTAMPRDPSPAHASPPQNLFASAGTLLRRRRYLIVVIACGLIQCAHAFYYGFSTLTWRAQDISATTVGWLWAWGVLVEVVFFLLLPLIERRTTPEALILIGAAGAAVRWTLLGFSPLGWVLWPIQAMHAMSFAAAHVGAMRLIYRETPENSAGLAQTLYAVSTGGILMGASTLLSGFLYDVVGAKGYWAMAALAAAGGLLALLLLAPRPRVKIPAETPQSGEAPP